MSTMKRLLLASSLLASAAIAVPSFAAKTLEMNLNTSTYTGDATLNLKNPGLTTAPGADIRSLESMLRSGIITIQQLDMAVKSDRRLSPVQRNLAFATIADLEGGGSKLNVLQTASETKTYSDGSALTESTAQIVTRPGTGLTQKKFDTGLEVLVRAIEGDKRLDKTNPTGVKAFAKAAEHVIAKNDHDGHRDRMAGKYMDHNQKKIADKQGDGTDQLVKEHEEVRAAHDRDMKGFRFRHNDHRVWHARQDDKNWGKGDHRLLPVAASGMLAGSEGKACLNGQLRVNQTAFHKVDFSKYTEKSKDTNTKK